MSGKMQGRLRATTRRQPETVGDAYRTETDHSATGAPLAPAVVPAGFTLGAVTRGATSLADYLIREHTLES